jgi:TrmH family RNA methyltransferase
MKRLAVSVENAEFQVIEALKSNRAKRAKLGEVFIEGVEAVKQAAAAGVPFTRLIVAAGAELSGWARLFIAGRPEAVRIDMAPELFRRLADRAEAGELLATAAPPRPGLGDWTTPDRPFVLVFDRPSDYGNFGSIVRSANAFGADAVLVLGHGIDPFDPKSIRASLGGVFRTPIVTVGSMAELEAWFAAQKARCGLAVVGTDSAGADALPDSPLSRPIALCLGNEAKGLSVALKAACDRIVAIPMAGAVDSLNVACAGTVFLYEVFRNGRGGGPGR